ncbi:ABC transporter substrate-binding protein [Marinobacter sp. F3R08]|uniref:ABC transporter substrate-binding protein n=1 Tax=Marinobacter sp. F3R08 TaxID=2841559 RepID=UPI001C085929|nr:NrtA/SsuA/CpmA family ABC transporter substrate-binding protein [Marinobacter sp. F3R08]MBU2953911.1 NrtA/SsuA/CpmA family ABC transporter substrate-binding protein [Marinobacter sp. F3R08]
MRLVNTHQYRRWFLSAVACFLPVVSQAATEVNIGVQPATQPIYIAKAAGYLAPIEEKYDVSFVFHSFSYGAPENQALATGALDLASAGMGPAIVASARLPAQLLGITILEQTAIIVPADSGIASVEDLKGKKIAYPGKGSQQYPLLVKGLADAGMTVADVQLFKTKGSDVTQLVTQKDVDAGITWDPHVSKALASGDAKVLLKAESILPLKSGHYIGNGFYGRTEFIENNEPLVQDVMGALVQAIQLIKSEPETAIGMWSDEIGFPSEVIAFSLNEEISVYDPDVVPGEETISTYTRFLKDAEILMEGDAPKVNSSFAAKALAN